MKKKIPAFLILLILASCVVKKKAQSVSVIAEIFSAEYVDGLSKEAYLKLDTIKIVKYDTVTPAGGFDLKYRENAALKRVMEPYFLGSITEPGNNNQFYIEAANSAKKSSALSKQILIQDVGNRPSKVLQEIGGIEKLNESTFEWLPCYYLSPNVVSFKPGESIKNYYTLDTTTTTYKVIINKKLVAFVNYNEGRSVFWNDVDYHRDRYNEIIELGKTPIGFQHFVVIPGTNISSLANNFGYIDGGKLFLVNYFEGLRSKTFPNDSVSIEKPCKVRTIFAPDAMYSKGGGTSMIEQRLRTAQSIIMLKK